MISSRKRRIYFFELSHSISHILLPYVYGCLRAYCEEDDELSAAYQWAEPFFLMTEPQEFLQHIAEPDVVCFSTYVWNWSKNKVLSRLIKQHFPQCTIVFGGPHVPDDPSDFFAQHPWIDVAFHKEGELSFAAFLKERLQPLADYSKLRGFSYRERDGHVTRLPSAGRPPREMPLPSPYLKGYLESAINYAHEQGRSVFAMYETNRGCPYSCTYCDWGSLTATKIQAFPLERTLQEIDYLAQKKVDHIYCADANFGILARDKQIVEHVVQVRKEYGYPLTFTGTMAKNSNRRVYEINHLLFSNGLMNRAATLSVQTMSKNVLEAIERQNIGVDKYIELRNMFHSARGQVPTFTDLILGLPEESYTSFRDGMGLLMDQNIHEGILIYPCQLLPNAPMNNLEYKRKYGIESVSRKLMYRMPFEDGELADRTEIVIRTNSMSYEDWKKMQVYGSFIQVLHAGGATRFLSAYLRDQHQLRFHDWYTGVFDWFLAKPDSVLGQSLQYGLQTFQRVIDDEDANWVGFQRFAVEYQGQEHWVAGAPVCHIWMSVALHLEKFYAELRAAVQDLFGQSFAGFLESDLWNFQKEIMLTPDYDPAAGKRVSYHYNWHEHFFYMQPLQKQQSQIIYRDQFMGCLNKHSLKQHDVEAFRWASQAVDPAEIRRYRHQLDVMEVVDPAGAIRCSN